MITQCINHLSDMLTEWLSRILLNIDNQKWLKNIPQTTISTISHSGSIVSTGGIVTNSLITIKDQSSNC